MVILFLDWSLAIEFNVSIVTTVHVSCLPHTGERPAAANCLLENNPYVISKTNSVLLLPFSVAFFKTFIAYRVPESGPTIFLTRKTCKIFIKHISSQLYHSYNCYCREFSPNSISNLRSQQKILLSQ